MRGSGNGAISLLSEYIANRVACLLGWPVPNAAWIYIEAGFPWVFGTDEFDDILVKSYGWNLGIEYLEHLAPLQANDMVNTEQELLDIIYTIDLFFLNVDRTTLSSNLLKDGNGKIWVIDHGQLMLFQPVQQFGTQLFATHCFHEHYKNKSFHYKKELHDPALFKAVIDEIPLSITEQVHITKETLLALVKRRMEQLDHEKV